MVSVRVIPMMQLLSAVVGKAFMGYPLTHSYSIFELELRLAIVIFLGAKEIIMKAKSLSTVLLITFPMLLSSVCSGVTTPLTQPSAHTTQPSATLPALIHTSDFMTEGRLDLVRYADIALNASGVISQVLVKEGDTVKKGERLIQLGDALDRNYAAAQLELVNAQQALNDLQNTAGEDLAQVVIELKDAKEMYEKADNYLNYLKTAQKVPQTDTKVILVQTWKGYQYDYKIRNFKGPAPQDWIIEAENDLALKKARLEALQSAYVRMKDGIDKDELAVLEARLQAAKAGLAEFSVIAPFDGVVTEINAKEGSSIHAGEIVVTVADFSQWLVKTNVAEFDVVKLSEGQPVIVTLDALPDVELNGEILSIGQGYLESKDDIIYEVTILLTDTNPTMRWGMTAEVHFENLR